MSKRQCVLYDGLDGYEGGMGGAGKDLNAKMLSLLVEARDLGTPSESRHESKQGSGLRI